MTVSLLKTSSDMRAGRMVILVDEETAKRRRPGARADHVTPEAINFMALRPWPDA
jgi:3,4-dihydroxy-2-butanone 4-phosphate synthase